MGERDVFAVLHYTYKRKEMRSGTKGVEAFCCSTVPSRPRSALHDTSYSKYEAVKKFTSRVYPLQMHMCAQKGTDNQ